MTTAQGPDSKKPQAALERIRNYSMGASVSATISLGRRLGLYGVLKDAGPVTSEELARGTGLHKRWLLEWLRGQAAAGVVDYLGDERFELSAEVAVALADQDHLMFLGHVFDSLPSRMSLIERMPEAFRTGIGLSWDDRGAEAAALTEGAFRNWYRQVLVPTALPLLEGVVARLETGGKAADIGCGAGIAVIEMAKAFPQSDFHGYELSEHSIARAEANRRETGVANLAFHNVETDPMLADESFDFITTFDCLHDMTRPDEAAAAIRGALKPDGVWFIVDVNCAPTFEENLANPLAPMFYAASIFSCMSSALSEPGGAGLGTCGLPEPSMRELVSAAGFTRFRRLDLSHRINAYYEVRP